MTLSPFIRRIRLYEEPEDREDRPCDRVTMPGLIYRFICT